MKHTSIIVAIGLALAAMLSVSSAMAQGMRTFVAPPPAGNDANPCTITQPCRFLQRALTQTAPGGEIAVLGTAGYNNGATVNITQAISIVNPGGFEAGIFVLSGGTGITINAAASDAVSLRGLTIEGGSVGQTGIQFNTGKSLTVVNCVVRNLVSSGIAFAPNATSSIAVSNTFVANNGGHGIFVQPTGSGFNVTASFNRVEVDGNAQDGIGVFGNLSTGTVKASVSDSVAAGNGFSGYVAYAGTLPTTLMVVRSVAANNSTGLHTNGTNAIIRVANSTVTGNGSGWTEVNGGSVLSAGDNTIEENISNQTAPPTYALK